MVVTLLEEGAVVTESVEFPDPVTGNPREVDIVVIRGQLGGTQVQIGIECIEHGRKATVQWVEMQHGKHSRLQATAFVILVSDSGFTRPAREVAEQLGYVAIHPNIAESELAAAIGERYGSVRSVKAASVRVLKSDISFTYPTGMTEAVLKGDGGELWYLRADGSQLVSASTFGQECASAEVAKDMLSYFAVEEGYRKEFTAQRSAPTYQDEPLYVLVSDGQSEAPALVEKVVVTARIVATNTASPKLTHAGTFGRPFATGSAPIGDSVAVHVVTDVNGVGRSQVRFDFDAYKVHDESVEAPKKRSNTRKSAGKRR